MYDFNQFANGRFARTQPREWESIPWAGERKLGKKVLKVGLTAVLFLVVILADLWAIGH